jgi:hypothetical protein
MKYLIAFLIAVSSLTVLAGDEHRDEHRDEYRDDKYEHCIVPETSTYASGVFVLATVGYVFIHNRKKTK